MEQTAVQPAMREQAAARLTEATEHGNCLPPLPPEMTPRSVTDGCRIASLVLDRMGAVACGLRLGTLPDGRHVPGPLLEGRLLPNDSKVALSTLNQCRIAPAVVGVLASDLARRGDEMPEFAALHPAVDFSGWRLCDIPAAAALAAADAAGLGLVVVGPARRMAPPELARIGFVDGKLTGHDVAGALLQAANAARRMGGLPQGALLQVVFGPGVHPNGGTTITASLGRIGRATAICA